MKNELKNHVALLSLKIYSVKHKCLSPDLSFKTLHCFTTAFWVFVVFAGRELGDHNHNLFLKGAQVDPSVLTHLKNFEPLWESQENIFMWGDDAELKVYPLYSANKQGKSCVVSFSNSSCSQLTEQCGYSLSIIVNIVLFINQVE